ncbi:hypothetical protein AB0F91_23435 [Amycolatopsis sp. NPDC023774]|uniref:hypothetical protein n=1 Tax=Amycolatopsis sp. NPDC023774 TaxID=3155015 RepID=UPI0033CD3090
MIRRSPACCGVASADYAVELASAAVNVAALIVVAAGEWLNGGPDPTPNAPVDLTFPTMNQLRHEARQHLPGSTIRRRPFWRHLLTQRKPLA